MKLTVVSTTSQLQHLPDGTLFSGITDQLQPDMTVYKKVETCVPHKEWPEGDIVVEAMNLPQFGEVPGERNRLGYTDKDSKNWHVWDVESVQKMIHWLESSAQLQ